MTQDTTQFEVAEDDFDFAVEVSESTPLQIVEMAETVVPSARCN
ncbi:hypothetical protein OG921_03035 [Aldersonia sp. NBC_00410]|nr:hypothetical protein [Aldersonia sp. NBC_00410]MCX5042166.1 hypothetical protein [Aldersonia sp. NBC_00410]